MDPVVIKCFVCNIKTDDWRSSLNGLKSQHSNTSIADFIMQILGDFKSMRNIEDEMNCICGDCLNKIEEYDWTCLMAKRCERELYDILIRTETACTNQEPEIDFGHIPDDDIKNDQVFSDLLVEAFTPIAQMDFEKPTIEQNSIIPQSIFIPTNAQPDNNIVSEAILAKADAFADNKQIDVHSNDSSEPDYEGEMAESDFSCDDDIDEDDDNDDRFDQSRTQCQNLEIDESDRQNLTEATSSTELASKGVRGRGRPRTKPTKNPNEIRKVGRPRTRPEKRRKREKRNYECKDCEQIFDKLREFVAHRRWHREENLPKFRCKICFYISDGQETFDAHVKLHDNVPPLQCVFCNVTVSCKGTLTKHTRTHAAVQNFQCELCGKQFVRAMSLKIHMKYHMNIRTKLCPFEGCRMSFVESKNLNRHLKTHTQIKPYSCSICSKRFAHSYNVRPHEKTHTDPNVYRKFKCNIYNCKSAFDSKTKLNQHLQKSHSMGTPHLENTNNLNDTSLTGRWGLKDEIEIQNNTNIIKTNISFPSSQSHHMV